MRNWFIIGFVLSIIGCWLMMDGIRDRFEHLEGDQPDSTSLSITESYDPAISIIAETISEKFTAVIEPISNKYSNASPHEAEIIQNQSELHQERMAKENITISDFDGQLQGNRYHQVLISKLIEEGWESAQLNMLKKYLSDPKTEFLPEVLNKNATHIENWEQYSHHLTPAGFEMCRKYWSKHHQTISSSAKVYNFPPAVIMGILKVETNFGQYNGTRSVFNVFWSLSLGDNQQVKLENLDALRKLKKNEVEKLHRRAHWARLQLTDLLYMAKSGGENPVGIMGSWAGAFGLCQFIPTSYRAYGRDGNHDNVIDLDNVSDAAASIANYLIENGWTNNMNRAKQKESIMRYNHSEFYADCVLSLADGIERQWKGLAAIE